MFAQSKKPKISQGVTRQQEIRSQQQSSSEPMQGADLPPVFLAIIKRVRESNIRNMLRLPNASRKMGNAPSTIWRDVKSGTLVPPIPIGDRAVGWVEEELDAVLEARAISARSRQPIDMKIFVALLIAPQSTATKGDSNA